MIYVLGYTVAFILLWHVSALCHELGHTLAGRRNGFVVTSFGVGLKLPVWATNWWGTRLFIGVPWSMAGVTFWFHPQMYPPRRCLLWALAGGMLAQFALALVAAGLWLVFPSGLWSHVLVALALLNLMTGALNLIPISLRLRRAAFWSDGSQMLRVWRGRPFPTTVASRIQFVQSFRPFWLAVGDRQALCYWLYVAAAGWLEVGNLDRARAFIEEAESLDLKDTFLRAFGAFVRGPLDGAAGQQERSLAARLEAEQIFQDLHNETGLFLLGFQAIHSLAKVDARAALAKLADVEEHPLVRQHIDLQAEVLCIRLVIHAELGEDPGPLLATYADPSRFYSSTSRDLRVHGALARMHARWNDWQGAEQEYAKALVAAQAIYLELASPPDRLSFLQGQQNLLADMQTCLRALGKEEEAKGVEARLVSAREVRAQAEELRQKRESQYRRWGLTIAGINVLAFGGACAYFWLSRSQRIHEPSTMEILCAMIVCLHAPCTILCFLYACLLAVLRRFHPSMQRRGGIVLLFLAVLPWIVWLLVVPASFFTS
jgi:hypothetical protein